MQFLLSNLKYILQLFIFVFTYFKGRGDANDKQHIEQLEEVLDAERKARLAALKASGMSDDKLIDSVYKQPNKSK